MKIFWGKGYHSAKACPSASLQIGLSNKEDLALASYQRRYMINSTTTF